MSKAQPKYRKDNYAAAGDNQGARGDLSDHSLRLQDSFQARVASVDAKS